MQQIKHFTSSDNRRGQTATNVHISEAPDITVNDWLVFFAPSQTMCADVCEWGKKENKKKEKKRKKDPCADSTDYPTLSANSVDFIPQR